MSRFESQSPILIPGGNLLLNTPTQVKEGAALIAAKNSSTKTHLSELQGLEKDTILAADPKAKPVQTATNNNVVLPSPKLYWGSLNKDANQTGLIAILTSVMCKEAKADSNAVRTMWKQASQAMLVAVDFTPIIGDAIQAEYNAQSAITSSQSTQSEKEGISSIFSFGGGIAMAAWGEYNDEDQAFKKGDDDITDEDEVDNEKAKNYEKSLENRTLTDDAGDGSGASSSTNRTNQEEAERQKVVRKEMKKAEKSLSFKERAKKDGKWLFNNLKKGQKTFSGFLKQAQTSVMVAQAGSEGFTKLLVTSKYQSQQAALQSQQGGCSALAKEAENYNQFYNQDFSRTEDIRQGNGQAFQEVSSMIQHIDDTLAQAVVSMCQTRG